MCVCVMTAAACVLCSLAEEEQVVLDRASCAAALAALRHTKWFQVCDDKDGNEWQP